MNQKLIVQYSDLDLRLTRGVRARLVPVDHPRAELNGRWVSTSPVVQVRPGINGPVIETKHTLYKAGEIGDLIPAAKAILRNA